MANPIVHCEIGCRDLAANKAFYSDLFGWSMEETGPNSSMFSTGSKEGIAGHLTALGHEPHNYLTVYVQVDDLEATLVKAETLGAKKVIPPTEVPGMGHFAWLSDPEGTTIGLWKPLSG